MRKHFAVVLFVVCGGVPSHDNVSAIAGLVLGYPLDEGSGTVVGDVSTSAHHGVVTNGAGWTPSGKHGGALTLNGTSRYVRTDSPGLPTGDFTWALWISRRGGQGFQTLLEAQGATAAELELNLVNGAISVWSSGAERVVTAAIVPFDSWTHVALTRAGGTLRLYINGVQDPRTGSDSRVLDFRQCPLLIGVDADSGCVGLLNGYFDGTVDEVQVYGRALAPSEIQQIMNAPLSGSGPDVTPPTLSSAPVIHLPPGTATATAVVTTSESALCRYDTVPAVPYAAMGGLLSSADGLAHSLEILALTDGITRTYYVKCRDSAGNVNPDDLTIQVNVGTVSVPPSSAFHVAPGGSDANPGTFAEPFRTIGRAQQAVRSINGSMSADVTVYLRGGEYTLESGLVFSSPDSGSNGFDVIYAGWPGERPVLHGGQRIGGWTPAGEGLYKANAGGLRFRQLYVNGRRATRARTPDDGYYQVRSWSTATRRIEVAEDEIANWAGLNQVEMIILGTGVNQSNLRISSFSVSGTGAWVTPREPERTRLFQQVYPPKDLFRPYYFENSLEFLDTPGEWYLNPDTSELFYMPLPGEDMSSADVVAPRLETIMTVAGSLSAPVHNLQFKGLTFAYSTWLVPDDEGYVGDQASIVFTQPLPADEITSYPGHRLPAAVHVAAAQAIRFERNVFHHLGSSALNLYEAVDDSTVIGNVITDTSGSGISLDLRLEGRPDDPRVISDRNVLSNNYISRTGRDYFQTVGIMLGYTQDTLVEHNELSEMPYSGISVGWGWADQDNAAANSTIRYNKIERVLELMGDGGGIYTLSRQPGTSIVENHVHDITRLPLHGFTLSGIYLDQGSNFITVRDNVLTNTGDERIFQNATGSDTTLVNNDGSSPDVIANAGLEPAYADIRPGASPPADTTPPLRFNGQPAAILPAGTTETALSVTTHEAAVCRFDNSSGVAFENMTGQLSTAASIDHTTLVAALTDGSSIPYYIRCQDTVGNTNVDDFLVTIAVEPGPDTVPPVVQVESPSTGDTVAGSAVVAANATDNVGVTRVEFYVDAALVGFDDTAPYAVAFDSTTLANGPYALTAHALDAAGNRGLSAPVNITITNRAAPPTIAPAGGAFTGSVAVTLATTTPGAEIRYTTDGTTPAAGSTLYTSPFTLTATATVTAVAFKTGMIESAVASAGFVISAVDTSLTGAFAFDEGSGPQTLDSSVNGNVGTLRNGVSWTTQGRFGAALNFDGVNDYVQVASPDLPTRDFTWHAWIKGGSWKAFQAVMMARDGIGPELNIDGAGRIVVYSSGQLRLTSAGQVPAAAWTHIALTRTGNTLRVYLNGVQDSVTGVDGAVYNFGTCPLLIGVDADSGCTGALNGRFAGTIDQVRIHNRALSAGEIQNAMSVP
jgi:hypothetical protein